MPVKYYTPGFVTEGSYLIGDRDYGYYLCRLKFYEPVSERLTDEELYQLADDIARLISERIAEDA